MKLPLCLLASSLCLLALVGCRTAGPQVCVRDSHHVWIPITDSNTDANQGKTVPVKAISDLALSAAQTGNPTANMGDGGDQLAPAVAPPAKADPAAETPDTSSTSSTESTAHDTPADTALRQGSRIE